MPHDGLWPIHARQWSLLAPPFRPSPADVALLAPHARAPRAVPPAVLILGVTPETATLPWPAGTDLVAVDHSQAMIDVVWPIAGTPAGARALLGDWRALPLPDASRDLVFGDGSATLVAYPHDTRALFAETARVLRPGGRFVLRAFVLPTPREPMSALARDIADRRIGDFNGLRLRLLMVIYPSSERGVRLVDAYAAWQELAPDPRALVAHLGFPPEVLATIELYRDTPTTYVFASVAELDAIAREVGLVDCAAQTCDYELGERCPTITWRKA